jgi:hypothetical protein
MEGTELDARRRSSGVTLGWLWLEYFALGGAGDQAALAAFLDGADAPGLNGELVAMALDTGRGPG